MKTTILAALLVPCAFAQPGVIRVVRNGSVQPYVSGKTSVDVVGLSPVSGLPESWLMELHGSFASLEDVDRALNNVTPGRLPLEGPVSADQVLSASNALIASYRPELSYRPDQAMQNLPKSRYLEVEICRIQPGTEGEFAQAVKLRVFSSDSINLDRPQMVYRVVSGAPSGTYIFLTPLPSLRVLDDARAAAPVYAEGAAASAKKSANAAEIIRENLWFRLEPRLSYVSNEFASGDAGFWHPNN
jgi:hypothetical protein